MHHTPTAQLSPAEEEYIVLAAALDAYAARWKRRRMVVHAFTEPMVRPGSAVWDRLARMPGMTESTMADFEARHTQRRRIGLLPPTNVPVILVEERDLIDLPPDDRTWGESMWLAFNAQFGGVVGIHALSRVGFSADGGQAVLVVRYNCGPRCGIEIAMLLVRNGESWCVVEEVGLSFH